MANEQPVVVAIAGPNGAGKSTAQPLLLAEELAVEEYVNADVIAAELRPEDPAGVAIEAGRRTLARLRQLADERRSFAFETTLAGQSYAPWLKRLQAGGYRFYLWYLWLPSPEMAVVRVAHRVRLGGHSIPEEVIRRRYRMGLRNFHQLYRGLADRWWLCDNRLVGVPRIAARGVRELAEVIDETVWRASLEVAGG